MGFVKDIAAVLGKAAPRVLVLGVGYSSVGASLFKEGFTDLTLTDIDSSAIDFQRSLFEEKSPSILCDDILASKLPLGSHDIIIDASVADVFIRQKSSSGKVLQVFEDLLAANGVMLSLSIFHKPWKRLTSQRWITSYGFVPLFIRSSRRPLAGGIARPIAVLVHQRPSEWREVKLSLDTQLLSSLRATDMQRGAEDF